MRIAEEVRERFLQEHSGQNCTSPVCFYFYLLSFSLLSPHPTESDKFDPRDLQRVRTDLEYVAKFTRQQRGNHDNIINQMVRVYRLTKSNFLSSLFSVCLSPLSLSKVESLKWRHSFGVNGKPLHLLSSHTHHTYSCANVCADIQFEDIEDYLWRSGMAFNHGIDKQGHHIGQQKLCLLD